MVSELVHEDVVGEIRIDGCRRLEVVDAATAVLLLVDEDFHELVGGGRQHVSQAAVVKREQVAFRTEDVVLGGNRRSSKLPHVRPVDPGLLRREVNRPDIEIGLA